MGLIIIFQYLWTERKLKMIMISLLILHSANKGYYFLKQFMKSREESKPDATKYSCLLTLKTTLISVNLIESLLCFTKISEYDDMVVRYVEIFALMIEILRFIARIMIYWKHYINRSGWIKVSIRRLRNCCLLIHL